MDKIINKGDFKYLIEKNDRYDKEIHNDKYFIFYLNENRPGEDWFQLYKGGKTIKECKQIIDEYDAERKILF